MLIRRYESTDADRVREIHAKAFRRIDAPEAVPPEVALFDALVEADDVIPQLSLVAVGDADLVGHVMCSRATVGARVVAALGPISVDPANQRQGVGLAMMHAVLSAADALDVPLVGLLGSREYYSRFRFTLAETLGIESPYPELSHHFQVRILAGYDSSISGRFRYAGLRPRVAPRGTFTHTPASCPKTSAQSSTGRHVPFGPGTEIARRGPDVP